MKEKNNLTSQKYKRDDKELEMQIKDVTGVLKDRRIIRIAEKSKFCNNEVSR